MKPLAVLKTLVVLGLLGFLVAVIWPTHIVCVLDDSPIRKAKSDILTIETALNFYRLDNLHYPTAEQGIAALVKRPDGPGLENWRSGGYLDRIPRDPWGNHYQFAIPGEFGEIDIFTFGRDGRAGGDGMDATIGNWNLQN